MSDGSALNENEGSNQTRNIVIAGIIAIVSFVIVLIVIAVLLALNPATTAPSVVVIRDLLIIAMAFLLIVIGVSFTVLLVQIARFVNLMTNEVRPLIETTTDTVNTVRGTAVFISKHVTEPIISTAGALGGVAKVVGDVEMIRKAASMVMQAAVSSSVTGAKATGNAAANVNPTTDQESTDSPVEAEKNDQGGPEPMQKASVPDNC